MATPSKIAVFDTETTGTSVENDRILTAFLGIMTPDGELVEEFEWVIDPGVEIPDGAAEVHGYTTERIRAEGRKDVSKAIFEIAQKLDIYDKQGIPIAIQNAPFDLTLMDREMRRHGWTTFRAPNHVIDGYVLDKALDKYRKGSRKLVDTARHYGVPVSENAHQAREDCIMAGRLAYKILEHPRLKDMPMGQIHAKTRASKKEQSDSFREYLRKKANALPAGDERNEALANAETVSSEWPMIEWVG